MLDVSICMSTHNKPELLAKTLESIYRQSPPFDFETIVVDDGSKDSQVREICERFPVRYHRIEREPIFRNPCVARNAAYRMARADVIISQSDEVLHITPNTIELLVKRLEPGTMLFANVFCLGQTGNVDGVYTGPSRRAPYFFLGSLYREDLYAVGGNDEDFIICPAWEDQWFADCLIKGRKLKPAFSTDIIGHHQWHTYCTTPEQEGPSRELYQKKLYAAMFGGRRFEAAGGPWPFVRTSGSEQSATTPASDLERKFTDIYRSAAWGQDQESRSGAGSSVKATEKIREALPVLLASLGVRKLLDVPCGDFNWMQHVGIGWIDYVGADIVGEMIDTLNAKHGNDKRRFEKLDLLSSLLPRADLVLCRDCLQHLSYTDFRRAIMNIKRSGAKYLLATTFPEHHDNRPIETGEWFPYNLQDEPFNLPLPMQFINEDCQEWYPHFADKSLGLWRLSDIRLDQPPIKSLVVSVEYDDFLAVTLPRNMRHFVRTLVVTSPQDKRTQQIAKQCGSECYVTDAFYRRGEAFNKGAAIEEAFDVLGRDGWLCVWDADIVMPDDITIPTLETDRLYTPARCLLDDPASFSDDSDWSTLPVPTQPHEFDGYFQMFHASAIEPPWYGTRWIHAGGGDSDFQFRFPEDRRTRAPFTVLHLGTEGMDGTRIGRNWRGRVTPRIDGGGQPGNAGQREAEMRQMIVNRKSFGIAKEIVLIQLQHSPIPKRMSFFWHGGPMSWLRYLTLETFVRHNPGWTVTLHVPASDIGSRGWSTPERDDTDFSGEDWREHVFSLGVKVKSATSTIPGVAPAQASDLLAWQVLASDGGFYADMDIVWLKPLDATYEAVASSQAVFCLESGMLAVGFLGACPGCPIFRYVLDSSVDSGKLNQYQTFGTEALYRAFPPIGRGSEPIGIRTLAEIHRRYGDMMIATVPDVTVYPFDWRQVADIFEKDRKIPDDAVGIHWFGGSPIAQRWNRKISPGNIANTENTIAKAIRRSLNTA